MLGRDVFCGREVLMLLLEAKANVAACAGHSGCGGRMAERLRDPSGPSDSLHMLKFP